MVQASAEKVEHTGPAEKERVASVPAVGKNARSAFTKKKSSRAVCPKYQIVKCQDCPCENSLKMRRLVISTG